MPGPSSVLKRCTLKVMPLTVSARSAASAADVESFIAD
jgi:hypothetical protein